MRFFYRLASLKMLGLGLTIIITLVQETNGMQALSRYPIIRKAEELALQASEAAKKGDLTTSKKILEQIDSLTPYPRIKTVIQNSPAVQEAKRNHTQAEQDAISAAAKKAEEEKQAREQAIAARIVFEKETAQKQIAQMEEDKKRAVLREHQQQNPPQVTPSIPPTPQTQTHHDGNSFASSLMSGVIGAAKSTNPLDVPGFQTDKPKEAFLNAGSLGDAAISKARTNEVSQHLHTQAQNRKSFKIDPNTDPLFVEANRIIMDPQKALNEEIIATSDSGGDVLEEIKTCEEGGDEYSQNCSKRLEIVLRITPEVSNAVKYCPGHAKKERRGWSLHYSHWTEYCGGCAWRTDITPKKVEVLSEQWIDGCAVLEDLTEKGLCRYAGKTTSPLNEIRTIQGEPVTRDHFEEQFTYTCFKAPPTANSCVGLREKGCYQVKSVCKEQARLEKVGNYCILWEQTYACPSGKISNKSYRASSKGSPFCLTGNCADTSYEANNEMMNAMSHLYALREAQNDLRDFKVIFKGTHRWCTRNCLSFRDCCGGNKGWGVTLKLSDCDKAEIELRTLRDKNLCVQVGTYCAERDAVFKSCLRKKTTFCCYGTKMARLIQQNGRAQLGIGFGSPESPNCEGLSPEQLSRIDFSRINFSEIFEDIKNQTVAKDQKQSLAQVSTERLQNNMTLLTKPSSDPTASQKIQALKEKGF